MSWAEDASEAEKAGKNGGRDRDRTCDPYHVKEVRGDIPSSLFWSLLVGDWSLLSCSGRFLRITCHGRDV